jgi:hypothetical protein
MEKKSVTVAIGTSHEKELRWLMEKWGLIGTRRWKESSNMPRQQRSRRMWGKAGMSNRFSRVPSQITRFHGR